MGRGMQFMAVREDLLAVLFRIEKHVPLTYRLCFAPTPDPPTWAAAASINDFGVAVEGGANNQKRYLVMPTASPFTPYVQTFPNGETLGRVYPEGNPDSVVLTPAGLYSDWCIVGGDFGVALSKPSGYDLVAVLQRAVRAEFRKVGTCYVGPKAYDLAESGVRLAISTRADPKSDLRLPKRKRHAEPGAAADGGGM